MTVHYALDLIGTTRPTTALLSAGRVITLWLLATHSKWSLPRS